MSDAMVEIGGLATKLGEALQALAEAKLAMETQVAAAREATAHYRQLFDLVKQLQKEIHQAVDVCLNVAGG